MYDYNCPDCNETKLQSDKNARKINEVIEQVNALIKVNNDTVDFIEEKANEVVGEIAEIKVNENIADFKTSLETKASKEDVNKVINNLSNSYNSKYKYSLNELMGGADILRVHDVSAALQTVTLYKYL